MILLIPFIRLLITVIDVYTFVVIAAVLSSWFVMAGALRGAPAWVLRVVDILDRLTTPVLNPIRRVLPLVAGLDFSPVVLLFALYFLQNVLWQILVR